MSSFKFIETKNYKFEFVCEIKTENAYTLYLYKTFNGENTNLFLFIKESDVLFYSTLVTFDQVDLLNRGKLTLDFCFKGPRNSYKKGIALRHKNDEWFEEEISDISQFYKFGNVFIREFVDDNHGVGPLSLIYKTNFISVILDKSSNSEPLFDIAGIKDIIYQFKELIKKMPFNIKKDGKLISFSDRHSTRVSFEIGDIRDDEDIITDKSDLRQSGKAIQLLTKCLGESALSEQDIADIAELCGNDSGLLTNFQKALLSINVKNRFKKEISLIRFNDGKVNCDLSEPVDDKLNEMIVLNTNKIKDKIEANTKKVKEIVCIGFFEMIDITGKREFKFKTVIDDKEKTITGHCSIDLNDKQIDLIVNNKNRKYKANLTFEFNYDNNHVSNPSYTLTNLELVEDEKQMSLFD